MGFDLYGLRKGDFSANIHDFRTLWIDVSNLCSFTIEQYERGCFNDYKEFSEKEALHISECLESYLNTNIFNYNELLLIFYFFVRDSGGFVIG